MSVAVFAATVLLMLWVDAGRAPMTTVVCVAIGWVLMDVIRWMLR